MNTSFEGIKFAENDVFFLEAYGKRYELGRLRGDTPDDEGTDTFVMWFKDHKGILSGSPGAYARGDEWPTLEEARAKVMQSASARLMLYALMLQIQNVYPYDQPCFSTHLKSGSNGNDNKKRTQRKVWEMLEKGWEKIVEYGPKMIKTLDWLE